jgi:DNA-directed RNA polymerase subunit RPC12/RpoP
MFPRFKLDELNKTILASTAILFIASLMVGAFESAYTAAMVLRICCGVLMILFIIRIAAFSPELRYRQNQRYLTAITAVREFFRGGRKRARDKAKEAQDKWKEQQEYRYFVCPQCEQKLRVPKGKGKIKITCTRCKHQFIVKS